MDANALNWRKKSLILPANKVITTSRRLEELYASMKNDVVPAKPEKNQSEMLSSVPLDSNVKQEELTKHARPAQETITVREKGEAEPGIQNKELDEASRKETAPNKRMSNMDASKYDPVLEKLRTYEKSQAKLEDLLKESSRQVGNLAIENSNLSKALLVKDKMIDDLKKLKTQVDAELSVLISRLNSTEKESSSVKYEFRMLEKELEVRIKELEYNRLFIDESHKQRLENEKKMTVLEAECQRLRLLVQKRLPSSAALSNMKTEVDLLGRGRAETRRNKKNLSRDPISRNKNAENFVQIPSKQIDIIVEQLQRMEEENKFLKEAITNKTSELDSSRIMHSKTASRLSQMEKRLGELSSDKKTSSLALCSSTRKDKLWSSRDHALVPVSNFSEAKALDFSDMSLMNDFVEMERLALVSVETSRRMGHNHDDKTGKELVPVESFDSSSCDIKREIHSKEVEIGKPFDWLQVVLNAMSEQMRLSNRSMEDIFRDVKIALGYVTDLDSQDIEKTADSSTAASNVEIKVQSKSNVHKSISKIIELVKGICSSSYNYGDNMPERKHTSLEDYFIHVFRWNISELNSTLMGFIRVCDDLLNGKADFEKFAEALRFTLGWILANYESQGDCSCPRFKINGDLGLNAEARFEPATDKVKILTMQLHESKKKIEKLQAKLEALKESNGISREQIENQKLIKEDLDAQLSVAKAKLNEAFLKFSSFEVELEDKSNCCEELEAECLELQLKLESIMKKETPINSINEERKHRPSSSAASSKLAECPESILNLGKELKTSSEMQFIPTNASMNGTNRKNLIKRSSLRDQMLAEDDAKMGTLKAKEGDTSAETKVPLDNTPNALSLLADMKDHEAGLGSRKIRTVAVVSSRRPGQGGFSLLQKLLLPRKKSSSRRGWSVAKP